MLEDQSITSNFALQQPAHLRRMLALLRRGSTLAAARRLPLPSPTPLAMALSTRSTAATPLLSTEQVAALLADNSSVRLLDASWYLDKSRNGKQEFAVERLPGAAFFDIDAVSDKASSLPHMLPPPADFERTMTALGVANDDTVVVYVGKNCFR